MRRPPIDPAIAEALASDEHVVVGLAPEGIPELRRFVESNPVPIADPDMFDTAVQEFVSASGHTIRLEQWSPKTPGPHPCLYHVHGGGLIVGRAVDDMPRMAALGAAFGMTTVGVEYRLSPEHRYPAALDDVLDGLRWLVEHAAETAIRADAIVLSGVSAGGGLAAAAALHLRDHGGPALAGLLLMCPMLDDRNDSHSGFQMEGAGSWDRNANHTGWAAYLGEDRDEVPIYAAPGRAEDLSELPPTFIDVGSAETFRDENVSFAARIWASGGEAELHVWPGGTHGFDVAASSTALARAAIRARHEWLQRLIVSLP